MCGLRGLAGAAIRRTLAVPPWLTEKVPAAMPSNNALKLTAPANRRAAA